ncbi:tubby C-terminal domain-like protein [Paenibacillus sp. GYB006]|uniref:tubby C-terminal domain-like protein n=1 Tax=Paenibacillus sp. GYB006 TaxID=2994394 RepID=UPI003FA7E660
MNIQITKKVQRVYKNRFQRICDLMMNHTFVVNIKASDNSDNVVCNINEKLGLDNLIKSKWEGTSIIMGDFTVVDRTKIKTNLRVDVQIDGEIFLKIKKDVGDKRVFFSTSEDNEIVAEVSYHNPVFPRDITISLRSLNLHCLDIAALYYIFDSRC